LTASLPRTCLLVALLAIAAGCVGAPPQDLTCTSDAGGNHLRWSPLPNATSYNVYRVDNSSVNDTPQKIASTPHTSYTDANVTRGHEYVYWVTGANSTSETQPAECAVVSVPIFPGPLAWGAAVVGAAGVMGVVLWRRQR
jgi:hypothetical protein